jgi:translation elongation factor EF-G
MCPRLKHRFGRSKTEGPDIEKTTHDFDNNVETGFQLATFQGPLCAEPVEGMAYFIEDFEIDKVGVENEICKYVQNCCIKLAHISFSTESHGACYWLGNLRR